MYIYSFYVKKGYKTKSEINIQCPSSERYYFFMKKTKKFYLFGFFGQ